MSSAEEGLMALLEAMLTLAAREAQRPKPPPVKPGGYPEEHFLDLTEDERDEFNCSICYQVLKGCMQCVNNHKFCHSCLIVWETTGQYANRIRCPVCRTHGRYFQNSELDDRIGVKLAKCLMEKCKWTGQLKYLGSHQHTYPGAPTPCSESSSTPSMPRLAQASPRVIPNNSVRFFGTGLTTQGATSNLRSSNGGGLFASPGSVSSSTSQESIIELPVRPTRTLSLNNSRTPPVRRGLNERTPGSGNRITFSHTRPGLDNNNNVETQTGNISSHASSSTSTNAVVASSNASTNTTSTTDSASSGITSLMHTPRPPSGPRPAPGSVSARRLPRIINPPPIRSQAPAPPIRRYQPPETISLSMPGARGRPANSISGATAGLGEIRERLQESRSRLDNLMTSFSGELERSREQVSQLTLQRERQRQDQLDEVRELGQRLGQVAAELRRLLDHRRDAAALMSDDSSSGDENDGDEF